VKIDAHHHFWRYTPEEFGWIDDSMATIRRDFLPPDLEQAILATGIDGVVSVQARTSLEETDWLLSLAARHELIRGVVGWAPLSSSGVGQLLETLVASPKLRGLREVCQGQPRGFLLRPDFLAGVGQLSRLGLAYDLLIFESQLEEAIEFVDRFPSQVFVLDHVAKPRIAKGLIEPWSRQIAELAKRPQVYCKLSGMVTEADSSWSEEKLRPYFETVLEAFGPGRLMYGSDWPVCLARCTYQRWHNTVTSLISDLSSDEKADILGRTAVRAYDFR
jgi:L-fuconolactonase